MLIPHVKTPPAVWARGAIFSVDNLITSCTSRHVLCTPVSR